MNNLVELLEMQAEVEALIQEAVSELTVNEFNMLQEAGLTTLISRMSGHGTNAVKVVKKFGKNVMGGNKGRIKELNLKIRAADRAIKSAETNPAIKDISDFILDKEVATKKLKMHKDAIRKARTQAAAGTIGLTATGVAGKKYSDKKKAAEIEKNKSIIDKAKDKLRKYTN